MKETKTERRYLWIKILVAVMCAVFLVGLVISQYIFRTYTTYRVVKEVEVSNAEDRCMKMGDHLLLYNKDGMRCMDTKGKINWDISYQIQKPCVVVDGNSVAVAGYGEDTIYIMDEEGRKGEINTKLPIRNLCISDTGYVGAVLDDKDVYWIYIYDAKGNEMTRARTTMEQSGYPISISLSPNAKLLAVSYLYLDAGVVQSNVAFYNLGEVGQNYTDNYMSGYIYEEIVPEIKYLTDSVAMAVSNGRLVVYEGTEKPVMTKSVMLNDMLKAVYWGDTHVVLVYNGHGEQGRYFMEVYDLKGNLILEKGFDFEYTNITCQNEIITIYDSDEIMVLTLDGRERYVGSLGDSVRAIVPTSQKYRYLVLTDNAYKVIELE